MIPLEELLKPGPPEKPSGEDPARTGELFQLEQLIKGEPGAEEDSEPDWGKVRETALEILKSSKDLRVAVILSLASLRKEGIGGFRDGLQLLRRLVEAFWDSVFPQLDAEEPEDDPTRANALNSLSPPIGKEGAYRFVPFLRQVPLSHSRQLANYSLRDLLQAEGKTPADAKVKPVTLAQMEPAFRDSSEPSVKGLRETHRVLKELIELLDGLEKVYAEKCGGGVTPTFETLRATLQAMHDWVAQYVPANEPVPGQAAGAAETGEKAAAAGGGQRGAIESPRDVEAALRAVCDYYKRQDRSSPVPFLIERALRLLDKDFMQTVGELTPDSLKELTKLFGLTPQSQEKK